MKKFLAMFMIIMGAGAMVACSGAEAVTEDENRQVVSGTEQEQDQGKETVAAVVKDGEETVYTVSGDNMFGLEELTVTGDRAIAVFDKDKFDSEELYSLIKLEDVFGTDKAKAFVGLDNLSTYRNTESYIELVDGKYVVTAIFSYDEKDKESPDEDVTLISMNVLDRKISLSGEKIEVRYEINGGECIVFCSQYYDYATGKWSDVSENTAFAPLESK